ncbi:MAG: glycosyltransferase family 4 protein [Dehalococcoidales bacterium]|nr:glycosyltransferase family 4 protein [Dehalococcoidales bacterium]
MKHSNINTQNTVFVLVSFEGPDPYSLAGGLGVRMQHLSHTLAASGYETHLFFIGDPDLPGEEKLEEGKLVLHRWCQWISSYHRAGVYDGEEAKLSDFNDSLPPFLADHIIAPAAAGGKLAVVLGEEWQTAEALCRLNNILLNRNLRQSAIVFWNANNTYSFNRIDWSRLSNAATLTSVSRYMKNVMQHNRINPLVIPNGIPRSLLKQVDDNAADSLRKALGSDILLCKIARWDPDKRWMEAVKAVAHLKERGLRTTLLARGGMESYGHEVLKKACDLGLVVKDAVIDHNYNDSYASALAAAMPADIINIRFSLPLDFLSVMYRASDAVLANSGHEPFGIVGLEAMAAGGIVFTGSTGEDYAIPFVNSFTIDTSDPMEMVDYILYLKNSPALRRRMRASARDTARYFTWENALRILFSKLENQGRIQGTLLPQVYAPDAPQPPINELVPDDFTSEIAAASVQNIAAAGKKRSRRDLIHT